MAATGKTPILLYGSTTPTNAPAVGNLTNSSDGCEIAINVADKNLFFKDSTNAINTVPIRQSSTSSNGWLSSTDWNTFNNKASTSSPTFSGDVTLSTGNLVIGTSGKGIDFSATAGTGTSELLADYEEGTWTPTPKFGGGNTGMTYTSSGYYTKVGNSVTVWGTFSISANGSSTGNMTIEGLPYSIVSYGTGSLIGDGFTFTGAQLAVFAITNTSVLYATNQTGGTGLLGGYAYLTQAAISTGGKYFSVTYRTS